MNHDDDMVVWVIDFQVLFAKASFGQELKRCFGYLLVQRLLLN